VHDRGDVRPGPDAHHHVEHLHDHHPATTTTAPTTTAPVETTAPETTLPAGPAAALVPLFVGGAESAGWLFLGRGSRIAGRNPPIPSGNRSARDRGGHPVHGEQPHRRDGSVVLGENAEACFDGRVGPSIDVEVAAPEPTRLRLQRRGGARPTVAAQAPAGRRHLDGARAYRALGEAAFVDEPVDASKGDHRTARRGTDLDGDGDDEALATFEFIQPSAGPGAPVITPPAPDRRDHPCGRHRAALDDRPGCRGR
jgi:hypothetical protein